MKRASLGFAAVMMCFVDEHHSEAAIERVMADTELQVQRYGPADPGMAGAAGCPHGGSWLIAHIRRWRSEIIPVQEGVA